MVLIMQLSIRTLVVALSLSLLFSLTTASAHSPDKLRPARPLHGGLLKTVGKLRLELVVDSAQSRLYLRNDSDQRVALEGYTLSVKRWTQMVALPTALESHYFQIDLSAQEVAGDRLLIVLQQPNDKPLRAIFGPFPESQLEKHS